MTTKIDTVELAPYIMFNGTCSDAIHFYQSVLDARIRSSMTYGEMPECAEMPENAKGLIVNAQLVLPGGALLMAGDAPPHMPYDGIRGVSISLNYASAHEAERVFSLLADGGEMLMPFGPTFWAKGFGMAKDKFGVDWIVNGELL